VFHLCLTSNFPYLTAWKAAFPERSTCKQEAVCGLGGGHVKRYRRCSTNWPNLFSRIEHMLGRGFVCKNKTLLQHFHMFIRNNSNGLSAYSICTDVWQRLGRSGQAERFSMDQLLVAVSRSLITSSVLASAVDHVTSVLWVHFYRLSGQLSLLPSAGWTMSTSLRATGWRPGVTDWGGGGMSARCSAGPIVY